jgi:hypothetical protein
MLPSTQISSLTWPFFPNKILYAFPITPTCYLHTLSYSPWFDLHNNMSVRTYECKSWRDSLYNTPHYYFPLWTERRHQPFQACAILHTAKCTASNLIQTATLQRISKRCSWEFRSSDIRAMALGQWPIDSRLLPEHDDTFKGSYWLAKWPSFASRRQSLQNNTLDWNGLKPTKCINEQYILNVNVAPTCFGAILAPYRVSGQ